MPTVTLVPGDERDLFAPLLPLLEAAGADLAFDEPGPDAHWESLLASARRTGLVLLGAQSSAPTDLRPVVKLRKALGVTHNLRPVSDLPGLPSRAEGVDLLVVRETTEDIYAHLEHESIPGVFEGIKVTTRAACERIARTAFELAVAQGRSRVTIVHKANIMKLSDGLFLRTARAIAASYPSIQVDDVIVDALCMKLVLHPERFDVLLCGNLFGDIVADLCSGLVGGACNAPSINVAPGCTLFAPGHGIDAPTARDNPVALLVPILYLLDHVEQRDAAARLRGAIQTALEHGAPPLAGGTLRGPDFLRIAHRALAG